MAGGSAPYRRKNTAARTEHAEAVFDLRLKGHSLRDIDTITQDPNGPTGGHRISASIAKQLVREEAARRLDPKVDAWRALQVARVEKALARLDALEEAAHQVLRRAHITVNNGRIILLDGMPLPDSGPVLAAIDRLIKIEDARQRNNDALCRILGLNAPTQVEATVTETTQQDIAVQELVAEMKAKNANAADAIRAAREPDDG